MLGGFKDIKAMQWRLHAPVACAILDEDDLTGRRKGKESRKSPKTDKTKNHHWGE